jgi:hypothetical protein
MKKQLSHPNKLLCALTIAALSINPLLAENVYSIDTGKLWNDADAWGQSVVSANDYFISSGTIIHAPGGTGTTTFGGNSLTIQSGGTLALSHPSGGNSDYTSQTLSIPSLYLESGATIDLFRGRVDNITRNINSAVSLANSGTVHITSAYKSTSAYNDHLVFKGALSGGATISIQVNTTARSNDRKKITVSSANNVSFSGNWIVAAIDGTANRQMFLEAGAANSLGTGQVTLSNFAVLTNNAASGIDSLAGVVLEESTAALNLVNAWSNENAYFHTVTGGQLLLGDGASVIGELIINGQTIGTGTYDAVDLTSFGLIASGAGTLTVIPEPSTYAFAGIIGAGLLVTALRRRKRS